MTCTRSHEFTHCDDFIATARAPRDFTKEFGILTGRCGVCDETIQFPLEDETPTQETVEA